MKKIYIIFGFLLSLIITSCIIKDDIISCPSMSIEYTDMSGNNLLKNLSIYSPVKTVDIEDKKIFEVISLTDEYGETVPYKYICLTGGERPVIGISINETYSFDSKKEEKKYTLKIKIPPILGDSCIETFRFTYETNELSFTSVWYNDEKLLNIETDNVPGLYNGKPTVSFTRASALFMVIPVEK